MIIVLVGYLWGTCGATNTIEMSNKKVYREKIFSVIFLMTNKMHSKSRWQIQYIYN